MRCDSPEYIGSISVLINHRYFCKLEGVRATPSPRRAISLTA